MSTNWSQKIERRFAVTLPADLRAWIDQRPWRDGGGAEFCVPLEPAQLLEPEPGRIWAGFMLPDTIPLLGNGYGDWLCMRFAADGKLAEIIRWTHGGGDWIPYGQSVAESLVFDFATYYTPVRHTIYEKPNRPLEQLQRFAQWAATWLSVDLEPLWTLHLVHDHQQALEHLARLPIAESAVRHDRVLQWLASPLKEKSDVRLAQALGVAWEPDFICWLFDTQQIPAEWRERLMEHFGCPADELFCQYWDQAERDALAVTEQRQDLGWAFDISGWAAERRGAYDEAVARYLGGVQTSLFSDESVAFRTHWYDEAFGKFAAARLAALKSHLSTTQRNDPYLNLLWERDAATLRQRVREYWLTKARTSPDPRAAYRCYYRAGWDLGASDASAYHEIFAGLIASAKAAGARALAMIAELHRQFLD